MTLSNPPNNHNPILGVIPGVAEPLARSHRATALRRYLITPTNVNYKKLGEACQRLNHVIFLQSQMEDAA